MKDYFLGEVTASSVICSLLAFMAGCVTANVATRGQWERETIGRGFAVYDITGVWHWKEEK